jgi:hypothetical protein
MGSVVFVHVTYLTSHIDPNIMQNKRDLASTPKFRMPYYTRSPTTLQQEGSSYSLLFLFSSHTHGSLAYALVTRTDVRHPKNHGYTTYTPTCLILLQQKTHLSLPHLHCDQYIPSTHPSWPLSWIATDTGPLVLDELAPHILRHGDLSPFFLLIYIFYFGGFPRGRGTLSNLPPSTQNLNWALYQIFLLLILDFFRELPLT